MNSNYYLKKKAPELVLSIVFNYYPRLINISVF